MSLLGKLSSKEHYGLRLALHLAESYHTKKPVSLAHVSDGEKISMKYLEQLVLPFKKAGWVKSLRGREGGYVMTKNPKELSLKDLVDLFNKDKFIVECLSANCKCVLNKKCMSKQAWAKVQTAITSALNNISLESILKS